MYTKLLSLAETSKSKTLLSLLGRQTVLILFKTAFNAIMFTLLVFILPLKNIIFFSRISHNKLPKRSVCIIKSFHHNPVLCLIELLSFWYTNIITSKTPHVRSSSSFFSNALKCDGLRIILKLFPEVTRRFYNDFRCHYKICLIVVFSWQAQYLLWKICGFCQMMLSNIKTRYLYIIRLIII